jgi:EAL domain-containing protein (putative c-di-GMP-specific phosphodiesterase class I)
VYRGGAHVELGWVERIRLAIADQRLVLYAQPIVELSTGITSREELLVRMLSETGEVIGPGAFLPAAERFGVITDIDHWVIEQALALAATGLAVAINVSARSVGDPTILASVTAAIADGLDPRLLLFEITETAAMGNIGTRDFATGLASLGCGFALDDFGTGFGTFSYLKQLPADLLKIDIEFVRDAATDATSREVVRSIVGIANSLGKRTVAEGIENQATLALMRSFGVDYGQGYHLGRPQPLTLPAAITPTRTENAPVQRLRVGSAASAHAAGL